MERACASQTAPTRDCRILDRGDDAGAWPPSYGSSPCYSSLSNMAISAAALLVSAGMLYAGAIVTISSDTAAQLLPNGAVFPATASFFAMGGMLTFFGCDELHKIVNQAKAWHRKMVIMSRAYDDAKQQTDSLVSRFLLTGEAGGESGVLSSPPATVFQFNDGNMVG